MATSPTSLQPALRCTPILLKASHITLTCWRSAAAMAQEGVCANPVSEMKLILLMWVRITRSNFLTITTKWIKWKIAFTAGLWEVAMVHLKMNPNVLICVYAKKRTHSVPRLYSPQAGSWDTEGSTVAHQLLSRKSWDTSWIQYLINTYWKVAFL